VLPQSRIRFMSTALCQLSYLALVGGPRNGPEGHLWHSPNPVTSRQQLGSPAGLVSKPPDHTRLPVPGGQAGHPITSRTGGVSRPGTWPHSGAGQIFKPAPQSWPPPLYS
jgi:hypothetical protein